MRLIDADRLQLEVDKFFRDEWRVLHDLTSLISVMPTIEDEPVKHGRWILNTNATGFYYRCSECGCRSSGFSHKPKVCPNCDAKMDLEG